VPRPLQVSNQSSTPVTLVEMKLHQRLHLMGSSFMGQISKHIDVVRVLSRWAAAATVCHVLQQQRSVPKCAASTD
jgi:hypothetical protein